MMNIGICVLVESSRRLESQILFEKRIWGLWETWHMLSAASARSIASHLSEHYIHNNQQVICIQVIDEEKKGL